MPSVKCAKRRQRNRQAARASARKFFQKRRIFPPLLLERQHHMILIDRFVHGRDLALAERVVQSAVDCLGGEAKPGCGVAVDNDF